MGSPSSPDNISPARNEIEDASLMKASSTKGEDAERRFEMFKETKDVVNFRTLGWPWASIIFLKLTFATGVMSIPIALYSLGVCWEPGFCTYCADPAAVAVAVRPRRLADGVQS